ncbi:MAG: hypothetical protein ACYTEQ_00855 [Planctomycetota bacterium]
MIAHPDAPNPPHDTWRLEHECHDGSRVRVSCEHILLEDVVRVMGTFLTAVFGWQVELEVKETEESGGEE